MSTLDTHTTVLVHAMRKMSRDSKIIATILILLGSGLIFLMTIAVAGSSHNLSHKSRYESLAWGIGALVAGAVLLVMVWLPWRRILNR